MSEPVDPDLVAASAGHRASVLVAVALGGALGAPARYAVTRLVGGHDGAFPWATFAINVSGSLALGVLVAVLLARGRDKGQLRALLGTGFLGAYTTYSTFGAETYELTQLSHWGLAVANVAASAVVGVAAVALGQQLGRL